MSSVAFAGGTVRIRLVWYSPASKLDTVIFTDGSPRGSSPGISALTSPSARTFVPTVVAPPPFAVIFLQRVVGIEDVDGLAIFAGAEAEGCTPVRDRVVLKIRGGDARFGACERRDGFQ